MTHPNPDPLSVRAKVKGLRGHSAEYGIFDDRGGGWEAALAAVLALIPEGAVMVTGNELSKLGEALTIGSVSYDGDSWFAADAGYGYEPAEAAMTEARAILARLRETSS